MEVIFMRISPALGVRPDNNAAAPGAVSGQPQNERMIRKTRAAQRSGHCALNHAAGILGAGMLVLTTHVKH
jgi:hypothetical protein